MPALYDAKPIAVHLRQKDRDLIHRAAALAGERPSDFTRKAAISRARKVVLTQPLDSVLEAVAQK